jgi:competence ComEA-like helix-hairpin-helix protein
MKKLVQQYFYHTLAERRGTVILVFICSIALTFQTLLPYLFTKSKTDFSAFTAQIDQFYETEKNKILDDKHLLEEEDLFAFNPNTASEEELLDLGLPSRVVQTILKYRAKGGSFRRAEDLKKIYGLSTADYERIVPYITLGQTALASVSNRNSNMFEARLFSFNPNSVSEEELMSLGLSKKVANNIINYRAKGGRFKTPADFKKIYGLREEDYARLEAYLNFESNEVVKLSDTEIPIIMLPEEVTPQKEGKSKLIVLDINKATQEEWGQLKGIGSGRSAAIVKFRTALGGFTSVEQVKETYNLPDSIFQQIKSSLVLSPILRAININEADVNTLKAHPYINTNQANAIVNYRDQHGKFKTPNDLRQIKILSEDWLNKLMPYLQF